jgi:hypothetical protein
MRNEVEGLAIAESTTTLNNSILSVRLSTVTAGIDVPSMLQYNESTGTINGKFSDVASDTTTIGLNLSNEITNSQNRDLSIRSDVSSSTTTITSRISTEETNRSNEDNLILSVFSLRIGSEETNRSNEDLSIRSDVASSTNSLNSLINGKQDHSSNLDSITNGDAENVRVGTATYALNSNTLSGNTSSHFATSDGLTQVTLSTYTVSSISHSLIIDTGTMSHVQIEDRLGEIALSTDTISSNITSLQISSGIINELLLSVQVSTPSDASRSNWDSAYLDRLKWDGGTDGLVSSTARSSLGLVIDTNIPSQSSFNTLIVSTVTAGIQVPSMSQYNDTAISTGTLVKKAGDSITGTLWTSSSVATNHIEPFDDTKAIEIDRLSNHYAGVEGGMPDIIDNGDGTITVSTCTVAIYDNAYFRNGYYFRSIASSVLTPTNNEVSYITVSWNNGNPVYEITALENRSTINQSNVVPIARVFQKGNTLKYSLTYGELSKGLPNKEADRVVRLRGIERESGLNVSEYGTMNVRVDSGYMWFGINRYEQTLFQSTDTVNCPMYLYTKQGTTWIETPVSTYNNLWYQGATSTDTVSNTKCVTNWIYRNVYKGEVDIVLGTESSDNLATALTRTEPTNRPAHIDFFYKLVGKIIVIQGATNASSVQSIVNTNFSASFDSDHTHLTNIGVNTHAQIDTVLSDLATSTTTLNSSKANISGQAFTGDILAPDISATYGVKSSTCQITSGAGEGKIAISDGVGNVIWTDAESVSVGSSTYSSNAAKLGGLSSEAYLSTSTAASSYVKLGLSLVDSANTWVTDAQHASFADEATQFNHHDDTYFLSASSAAETYQNKLVEGTTYYIVVATAIYALNGGTGGGSGLDSLPVGAIIPYVSTSTIPADFLYCDGSAKSRTTYASLFLIIGTKFGTGDGSTTFNVPDFRGSFLRGIDNGRGWDSEANRVIGSMETDTMQGHWHDDLNYFHNGNVVAPSAGSTGSMPAVAGGTTGSPVKSPITDGTNGTPRTGPETRPKNTAVAYIIKYQTCLSSTASNGSITIQADQDGDGDGTIEMKVGNTSMVSVSTNAVSLDGALQLKRKTTAELTAISPTDTGLVYFNATTNEIWISTGTGVNQFIHK